MPYSPSASRLAHRGGGIRADGFVPAQVLQGGRRRWRADELRLPRPVWTWLAVTRTQTVATRKRSFSSALHSSSAFNFAGAVLKGVSAVNLRIAAVLSRHIHPDQCGGVIRCHVSTP